MMDGKMIAIITTCEEDWGGSEELWGRALPFLLAAGFVVTIYKQKINATHPVFKQFAAAGVALQELEPPPTIPPPTPRIPTAKQIIFERIFGKPKLKQETPINNKPVIKTVNEHLSYLFKINPPHLAVISQGINFDGIGVANECYLLGIPYMMIAQKAVEIFWPNPNKDDRDGMRNVYLNAKKTYFVSEHNKKLTEQQFACHFPNAEVICNPIKVKRTRIPMPSMDEGIRLACLGRYFLLDKGQDILIRVMARSKWKSRNIKVSFFGSGIDKTGLTELAQFVGATNVEFMDYASDIESIWSNHHALVLPSRYEGTPLVLLEAMACGRIGIVSNAGGNGEFIEDGYSGFIGEANEQSFDGALERAWENRNSWAQMGGNALSTIQAKAPEQSEKILAEAIIDFVNTQTS